MSKYNYFFCYDIKMSAYLHEHDFKYITKAIHTKSKKIFSLYEVTDELTAAINQFNHNTTDNQI